MADGKFMKLQHVHNSETSDERISISSCLNYETRPWQILITYGTCETAQPNNSGLWFMHAPTNKPPLDPPTMVILSKYKKMKKRIRKWINIWKEFRKKISWLKKTTTTTDKQTKHNKQQKQNSILFWEFRPRTQQKPIYNVFLLRKGGEERGGERGRGKRENEVVRERAPEKKIHQKHPTYITCYVMTTFIENIYNNIEGQR